MKKFSLPRFSVWAINFWLFITYWFVAYSVCMFLNGVYQGLTTVLPSTVDTVIGLSSFAIVLIATIIYKKDFYIASK